MAYKHYNSQRGKTTTEYISWCHLRYRCCNPKNHKYKDYGARGIKVCERWLESFNNFLEDMGKKPSKEYTIDRIDNNGDYEPSNCKWSNPKEQNRNQRTNVIVEYDGEKMVLIDFCKKIGANRDYVAKLIKKYSSDKIAKFHKQRKSNVESFYKWEQKNIDLQLK